MTASRPSELLVRELSGLDELRLVDGLFSSIWGGDAYQVGMPVNLLQALVHSGNYVAAAWRDGDLVGAAVAFLGAHDGRQELHSHVAGVARHAQATGVGRAIKEHQREWARRRGIGCITWTYDPLIRRNGWFNLAVLGATATEYHPDFYGPMVDELNGTDETDRCLVRWPTSGPLSSGAAEPGPAVTLLDVGRAGEPVIRGSVADPAGGPAVDPADGPAVPSAAGAGAPAGDVSGRQAGDGGGGPLLCQVPDDVVALRRLDPELAREWRLALRDTMGRAMDAGYRATGMTASGHYLLERGRP